MPHIIFTFFFFYSLFRTLAKKKKEGIWNFKVLRIEVCYYHWSFVLLVNVRLGSDVSRVVGTPQGSQFPLLVGQNRSVRSPRDVFCRGIWHGGHFFLPNPDCVKVWKHCLRAPYLTNLSFARLQADSLLELWGKPSKSKNILPCYLLEVLWF